MEQREKRPLGNVNFEIRKLSEEDYEEYCALRAEGLLDSPIAFTTSYNDFMARSEEKKKEIFLSSVGVGTENFTLAAFAPITNGDSLPGDDTISDNADSSGKM